MTAKDPNLDLETAMRIILKKHKEVLHKQLRDAMAKVEESSESSESDSSESESSTEGDRESE